MQTSTYLVDNHTQADGRVFVYETFVDDAGKTHQFTYRAPAGWSATEYNAHLAMRAGRIQENLQNAELHDLLEHGWRALVHQTAAEFGERYWTVLRRAFDMDDKLRYARLLYWLEERLLAGNITDAQARASFNTAYGRSLNAAQWTSLRTARIQPAHDRYAALLSEGAL